MASSRNGHAELVVVGGGPGGYPAAFAAADRKLDVVLVNTEAELGGVCLLRGCIPSQALLHVARLWSEAHEAASWGISFGRAEIDLDKLRQGKSQVVQNLTRGISGLCRQRGVRVIEARRRLIDSHPLTSKNLRWTCTLRNR